MGRTHVEHLAAMDGVEIATVAHVSSERADALATDCGAKAITDYRDMLHEVDALYVCSPPTAHREQVTAAITAGRHVFCEKPLATNLEDGRAIADAASAGGVHAMVGFNNRFRPAFRRLRDLLRGELGDLVSAWIVRVAPSTPAIGANWRTTPGLACGVTIESASHDIDFIRWACGEIVEVAGWTTSSLPELDGYDDTLNAALRLESGAAVTICISWASAVSSSSRGIVGSHGAAYLLGPDMWTLSELRWARSGGEETVEPIDEREGADLGYGSESEHFIECVRRDRAPDVTVQDSLAALEVSVALKGAATESRVVRLAAASST
jgi:UDP-N-acetylglucosamine 3-dehydrogenase